MARVCEAKVEGRDVCVCQVSTRKGRWFAEAKDVYIYICENEFQGRRAGDDVKSALQFPVSAQMENKTEECGMRDAEHTWAKNSERVFADGR